MKRRIISAVLVFVLCLSTVIVLNGCGSESVSTPETKATESIAETMPEIWNDAVYTEDTELGYGDKTITVEVEASGKSVSFTINTNAENLGDALVENELVEGETGGYGLYIKTVNGMLADYDTDKSYWAIYKDSEFLMTGADTTPIKSGEHYEFVYSK